MAASSILIVDDNPVNLKLTRILLVNEGYRVMTAPNADEAIVLLKSFPADLVLTDIDPRGVNGLELARRIKHDFPRRAVLVLGLTTQKSKEFAQDAIDAGCDGYLTRPVDAKSLNERIHEMLNGRQPEAASKDDAKAATGADLQLLRARFLAEGREKGRNILLDLEGRLNTDDAQKIVHQWIGTGGLLGYSAISRLAREAEAVLMEKPLDGAQFRETMTNLVLAFSSPREARDEPIPDSIKESLSGKRVALIGFPPADEERLKVTLERVNAKSTVFHAFQPPDSDEALASDLSVIHINDDSLISKWLDPTLPILSRRPIVLAGAREDVLGLDPAMQSLAREYLMGVWQPDEALVRFSLALSYKPQAGAPAKPAPPPNTRAQVVIADDDPAVLILVRTALENFGMTCIPAADGPNALAQIRQHRPQAAVLDVNMPGMDGYEVLAAIRQEEIPSRVLLLTARQQESDVLRGFTLGADDYVVKPFSPMELVARLKRLLTR
jgi:DNA-binding response OmpR family regulator